MFVKRIVSAAVPGGGKEKAQKHDDDTLTHSTAHSSFIPELSTLC